MHELQMKEARAEFRITPLSSGRWEEYRRLRLEALEGDPLAFNHLYDEEKDLAESEWKKRIHGILFAIFNDRPVGMIKCFFGDTAKTRHVAELESFYVSGSYRGRGIGKELFKSALALIRDNRGISKVKLTVNSEQKAAIGLYEKEGFAVVGRLRNEARVGDRFYDKLIMELLL
jgi:ribosomal protein S18 acetylase RimI-like enzyme